MYPIFLIDDLPPGKSFNSGDDFYARSLNFALVYRFHSVTLEVISGGAVGWGRGGWAGENRKGGRKTKVFRSADGY